MKFIRKIIEPRLPEDEIFFVDIKKQLNQKKVVYKKEMN